MSTPEVKRLSDKRILLSLTAGHLFDDIYVNTLPPLIPVLVSDLSLSFSKAGLLVTLFTISSSVGQPMFGYVTDKYRLKWISAVGLMWGGVFMGSVGLVGQYPLLILVAILAGLGPAMFHPFASAVVSELSTKMRGRMMSIFLVGGNLGFALGPLLVGFLTTGLGKGGMIYIAIPGLVMGFFLLHCAPHCGLRSVKKASPIRLKDITPGSTLLLAAILRSWAYLSMLSFIPSYFVHRGNSLLRSNSYLSIMLVAGASGQFVGGSLSDRYGRKKVAVIALFLSAPLLFAFLHTTGMVALVFLFLFGFTLMASFSVTLVMMQEIMTEHAGMAAGLMIGFAMGVGGIGVLITGFVADALGVSKALHFLVILPAIAGGLVYLAPHRSEKA